MTLYQGSLDGLCGQYAIANAFRLCGYDDEDYFPGVCRGLAHRRWPAVLWEGTSFDDMRNMIAHCRREFAELDDVTVRYPFRNAPPNSNKAYWKRFDETFENETVRCGIVGLVKPDPHWIVVRRDGRRLEFVDSTPFRDETRKNRNSVHAGKRRKSARQWLIDRRELITFAADRP